jgi:hypothetical protein
MFAKKGGNASSTQQTKALKTIERKGMGFFESIALSLKNTK